MTDILSDRLAELILQLHGLRDQLRSAVFQTVREAVLRTAGDAVDRLWRSRRQWGYSESAYDPDGPDDNGDADDGDERPWSHRRAAERDPARAKRNGALRRAATAALGWWLLRRCSLLRVLAVGGIGLAASVVLGPERVAPARIIELVIPAIDILSSQ